MKRRIKFIGLYSSMILIMTIFLFLGYKINSLPYINAIKLLVVSIFCVIIPGSAISALTNIEKSNFLNYFTLSMFCGYILNIVMYFLFCFEEMRKFLLWGYIVIVFFSVYILWKKKEYIKNLEIKLNDFLLCIIIIVIVLSFIFIGYCGNNLLPTDSRMISTYYNDNLYWVGNTIELEINFPPKDFRVHTRNLNYHYFTNIQMAVIGLLSRIPAVETSFLYSYIQSTFMLVMGIYLLFKKIFQRTSLVFIAMFFLLFTAGFENDVIIGIVKYIYYARFGYDIALAFSLFTFYLLYLQLKKDFDIRLFVLICLGFSCTLGSKSAVGAILICGLGIVCFFWLFIDRDIKKGFVYGITLLLLFLGIYVFFFTGEEAQTLEVGKSASNMLSVIDYEPMKKVFTNILEALNNNTKFTNVFFVVWMCFKAHGSIFALLAVGIFVKFRWIRRFDVMDIAILFMTVVGIVCTRVFKHFGYSQVYFIMAALPFTLIFGMRTYLECIEFLSKYKRKNYIKLFLMLGMIVTIIFALQGVGNFLNPENSYVAKALLSGKQKLSDEEYNYPKDHNTTSKDDMEAYLWVRENTTQEDLLLSDKILVKEYIRVPYAAAVFMERHLFMVQNKELVARCMNNDESAIGELKDNSVDYIIHTKELFPNFIAPSDLCELMYETDTLAIYKIL